MNSFLPGLYIVSTPIGNLDDITLRSLDILKKSDIILCEDTRRSLKLLNHYKIKKKLFPYHKFNEKKELNKIIKYLNEGKILSLVSDAGTPLLSDPGKLLVKECIKKQINIYPVPGPSSITASMSVSGFDDKFIFYGFLPKKEKELNNELSNLNNSSFSIIFFIPGVKINYYLSFFKKHFSSREILIAREITKIHETFYRDKVDSIQPFNSPLKGELTVVISKKNNKTKPLLDDSKIKDQAIKLLKKNSLKDVVKIISEKEKTNKRLIYKICLDIKNEKIT
ncbi:MAG: 16S rRNA (cytidine(1402)-2'-O)-methyltransferase [Pelagibacteraceae bacterium]|tara:strand:- start:9434 stop:10276 length:843 start_codon:yes stop_codon:yes gene_type:complete